ncbi:MAG: ATP-binding cassette domain-containing protein [Nautiliaceae bacterium]
MFKIDIKKELFGHNGGMILECKFEIKKGDFLAVSGPSGSGKTTLLRIIAGVEKARGEIIIDNEIWLSNSKILPPQKREVGFLFQDFALFPNMSVEENLLYVKKDKSLAEHLLKMADIYELKDRYPHMLSGGQKQRVALCRALMRKPKLLLLDEPFSALDLKMKEKLHFYIQGFHKEFNLTTIMVSHSLSEIYTLSNKLLELDYGKAVRFGNTKDILLNSSFDTILEGKILDILKTDTVYKVIVSVGNRILKVAVTAFEAESLKIGERVGVVVNEFNITLQSI